MTTSGHHLDERPTDPNNPDAIMLELVGSGRSVLQLGCADGHMTRWLAAAGCAVRQLLRPSVDLVAWQLGPRAAFPAAEIHFAQARV